MVNLNVENLMRKQKLTRYKLQQITNWNYKRINALYLNKVKHITLDEIDMLINVFHCDISDLIIKSK